MGNLKAAMGAVEAMRGAKMAKAAMGNLKKDSEGGGGSRSYVGARYPSESMILVPLPRILLFLLLLSPSESMTSTPPPVSYSSSFFIPFRSRNLDPLL